MKNNLAIIDGHNFLFRAFAVPFKFYSLKGVPLHVTTTFLSSVRRAVKIIDSVGGCSHIVVVFDPEGENSNHTLLESYKANRITDYSQMEDNPFSHLPYIKKSLRSLRIKFYEKRGVEADDAVASLATKFLKDNEKARVFIFSSDSDFYQLISKKISQVILRQKGEYDLITPKEVKNKTGVGVKYYVFWKCLVGDKCDNIPGVPGIGPKRAAQIINRKMKFDIKPYQVVLKLNERLITLNSGLNIIKNTKTLAVSDKILALKNNDIFAKLGYV